MRRRTRDSRLIDALDSLAPAPFAGTVWRVVREGRDPGRCSASGGRWDDATFEVLYTSRDRNGAIAEAYFHRLRGQPLFPSKTRDELHELTLDLKAVLDLTDTALLARIGVDMTRYGQLSYEGRSSEYPRTQDIAETARFLGCDGLLVPNARWNCVNAVVFCDVAEPGAVDPLRNHGIVDWTAWQTRDRNEKPA